LRPVRYAHVPLVLGVSGRRLAKRDGAVTLADQARRGLDAVDVVSVLAASVGLAEPGVRVRACDLVDGFDPNRLPKAPWTVDPVLLAPQGRRYPPE
ncbi:MAG: hypothetical protein H0U29_07475, partial [Acidimicrobiia bacterium]|nr:hypothetical protein [Acidimicrobiia bacterium]